MNRSDNHGAAMTMTHSSVRTVGSSASAARSEQPGPFRLADRIPCDAGGPAGKTSQGLADPLWAPRVCVVDDEERVRDALENLIMSAGYQVETYAGTSDFVASRRRDTPNCLILDIRLRAESGLDFQKRLLGSGIDIPLILITGYGDVPSTVQGMKLGAVDVLTKPIRPDELLSAVAVAVAIDRERRDAATNTADLVARHATLTDREAQVMDLVVTGLMNKQIAGELGLSEATIKIHRGSVMRKMSARTLPELVRMADRVKS